MAQRFEISKAEQEENEKRAARLKEGLLFWHEEMPGIRDNLGGLSSRPPRHTLKDKEKKSLEIDQERKSLEAEDSKKTAASNVKR